MVCCMVCRQLEGEPIYIGDAGSVVNVGALAPGSDHYIGLLQDVRIYSRKLKDK